MLVWIHIIGKDNMKRYKLAFGSIMIGGLMLIVLRMTWGASATFNAYEDMVDHYHVNASPLKSPQDQSGNQVRASWEKDDTTFLKVRQIVTSIIAPNLPAAVIDYRYQRFELIAQQHPDNPLALFGWGWAGLLSRKYESLYPANSPAVEFALNKSTLASLLRV